MTLKHGISASGLRWKMGEPANLWFRGKAMASAPRKAW